jgi:hypothetical protein
MKHNELHAVASEAAVICYYFFFNYRGLHPVARNINCICYYLLLLLARNACMGHTVNKYL